MYSQIILSEHFTTNKERKSTESCCFLLLILYYGSVQLFPTIENEKCAVLNDIRFEGFFLNMFFFRECIACFSIKLKRMNFKMLGWFWSVVQPHCAF